MSPPPGLEATAGGADDSGEDPETIAVALACKDLVRQELFASILEANGLLISCRASSPDGLFELDEPIGAVVVMASDIADPATAAAMRRIRGFAPDVRIVIISASSRGTGVRRALNSGADGFVLESRVEDTLACTVRAVHRDQVCAPREFRRCVAKPSFTHREKQILALVAAGASNKEIAKRLFLAESTVKSHLASLFSKLGVRSRKDAAAVVLDPQEGLQATALPPDTHSIVSLVGSNGGDKERRT